MQLEVIIMVCKHDYLGFASFWSQLPAVTASVCLTHQVCRNDAVQMNHKMSMDIGVSQIDCCHALPLPYIGKYWQIQNCFRILLHAKVVTLAQMSSPSSSAVTHSEMVT